MNTQKVIVKVTIIIAIIVGSAPGLMDLISDVLLQHYKGPYWQVFARSIPSIIVGISIGYLLSKYLLGVFIKTEKRIMIKSIIIFLITFIPGVFTFWIAWEVKDTIIPKLFGWEHLWYSRAGYNSLGEFLDGFLLLFIYFGIPIGVVGLLNGIFSFIYMKYKK